MDNKMIAIIAVVVVVIVAVAAAAVLMSNNSDSDEYVTYYANGGTSDQGDVIKVKDTVVLGTNLFTRDGYECTGYNDKKDGSGTIYGPNANVMLGTKLYAQWESADVPKLIVESKNAYTSKMHFTLDPSGVNIDQANTYKLKGGEKIRISPVGGTATTQMDDKGRIIMDLGEPDKAYYVISISMDNSNVTISGSDVIIDFTYAVGVNPVLNYFIMQVVP